MYLTERQCVAEAGARAGLDAEPGTVFSRVQLQHRKHISYPNVFPLLLLLSCLSLIPGGTWIVSCSSQSALPQGQQQVEQQVTVVLLHSRTSCSRCCMRGHTCCW